MRRLKYGCAKLGLNYGCAGVQNGVSYGATDELGFTAVENPRPLHDLHATVLHLLGLDNRRLEIPGRKRLDIDHGKVMREILV